MSEEQPEFQFEKNFARLEQILERMNSGAISLDESLHLYEEADSLLSGCMQRLNEAETRIETLIKKRTGELVLDASGQPQREPFAPESLT